MLYDPVGLLLCYENLYMPPPLFTSSKSVTASTKEPFFPFHLWSYTFVKAERKQPSLGKAAKRRRRRCQVHVVPGTFKGYSRVPCRAETDAAASRSNYLLGAGRISKASLFVCVFMPIWGQIIYTLPFFVTGARAKSHQVPTVTQSFA